MITNAPPVTCNDNGPNANPNDKPVASAANHDKPAVLVICTSWRVPAPVTAPLGTPPETCNRNAKPLAPAPAKLLEASNWVSTNEPLTVNNPTTSIAAEPDTCNPIWPFNADDKLICAELGIVTVDQSFNA